MCHYQESMISSSLVKHNLHQDTLYKTLILVLGSLEVKYSELLTGNRWHGIGTGTSPLASTFLSNADSTSTDPNDDDDDNYVVYTTHTGRQAIPFDTWVKDKICCNCNEVGHIQRNCPKLSTTPSPRYHTRNARCPTLSRHNATQHRDKTSAPVPFKNDDVEGQGLDYHRMKPNSTRGHCYF